LLFS
jgi:hypothetical protein